MRSKRVVWLALRVVVVLASLLPLRAHATGLLIPTDGALGPLAVRSHRVDVRIHERVAETQVTQVFHNASDRVLEAMFVFPVPPGASVSGFAMTVNGQRQEGQLLEAGEARAVYEGIVARLRDPGLVEYLGGNLFRARVYPIPARGDQTVEVRFTQTMDYASGTLHYRYPLRTTGPSATTLEDFSLRAEIHSSTPIRAIYSPTYRLDTTRQGDHTATVGFELAQAPLARYCDLYTTGADGDVGLSVLAHRTPDEDGYFMLMVAPRTEATDHEIIGKDLLFVVDTSGSMVGDKLAHAREALSDWIRRLNPDDTFNVLRFSTDVQALSEGSLAASADNRARALRFVDGFEASGGTAIEPALARALAVPVRPGAPRIVVLLTDGMPTVGETNTTRIVDDVTQRNHGAAQIFAFGLGDDVNTTFLDLLSAQNHGAADYAGTGAEMSSLLNQFYSKIAYPVFSDVHVTLPGIDAYDIYPREIGTLYRGGQVVVTGRYRTPGEIRAVLTADLVNVSGRTFPYAASFPAVDSGNDFIPRVWANRKVGYLLDEIRLHGENVELRDGVIALARRFGIVTPYTSFLVAEPTIAPPVTVFPVAQDTYRRGASTGASSGYAPMVPTSPPPAPSRAVDDLQAFQSLSGSRLTVGGGGVSPEGHAGYGTGGPMAVAAPHVAHASASAPVDATGDVGRRLAQRLRDLRESDQATPGTASVRYVSGRAFTFASGRWEESGLPAGAQVLRVRSLGRGYFALLRLRPALRGLLSVGSAVRFRLDDRHVIDVDPTAPDPTDAMVEAFLR